MKISKRPTFFSFRPTASFFYRIATATECQQQLQFNQTVAAVAKEEYRY